MGERRKKALLFGGVYLLNFGIYTNVFLEGDDYVFAAFHQGGIAAWWTALTEYYRQSNGRFLVNLYESLLLCGDRYVFWFLNPLLVTAMIYLLLKISSRLYGKKPICVEEIAILGILFAVLSIYLKHETIYWISGSANYLMPMVVLLLWYLSFLRQREGSRKWNGIFLLLCPVTGALTEQVGLMAAGILAAELAERRFYQKKACSKTEILGSILTVTGVCTVLLSSGTANRIEKEEASILLNIQTLLYNDFYGKSAALVVTTADLCALFWLRKEKGYPLLQKLLIPAVFVVAAGSIASLYAGVFLLLELLAAVISMAAWLLLAWIFWRQGKSWWGIWLAAGIGSQGILIVTDLWGTRTSFPWIVVLLFFIAASVTNMGEKSRYPKAATVLAAAFLHPLPLVIAGAVFLLDDQSKGRWMILWCALITAGFSSDLLGYAENRQTQLENMEAFRSDEKKGILYRLPNAIHTMAGFPMSAFHEQHQKEYYGKSQDFQIEYEEKE